VDSPGHVEIAVQEAFDEPVVVMFVQGSGGDASPAGGDNGYARMESVGDRAVEPIFDLWSKTPTSSAPLRLESVSRHIPEDHQDILVTRNGTVNWSYRPYEEGYWPDDIIYVTDEEGEPVSPVELMSPIDEFNTPYGSAFCGTGDLDLPVGGINTGAFPYSYCLDISLIAKLMKVFFKLDEDLVLPMNESIKAGTSTTRLGPIATLYQTVAPSPKISSLAFFLESLPACLLSSGAAEWKQSWDMSKHSLWDTPKITKGICSSRKTGSWVNMKRTLAFGDPYNLNTSWRACSLQQMKSSPQMCEKTPIQQVAMHPLNIPTMTCPPYNLIRLLTLAHGF
jgi:hypothetical protein